MIYKRLIQDYNASRLFNSYLVSTDDVDYSLSEIYKFLAEKIFQDHHLLNEKKIEQYDHPDLFLCKKEEVTAKNITIEQIRKLREFIYKSSVISGYKIGIITPADLMNDNAANSCLKILEDTPPNSLLVLVTTVPAALLQTIRSRCARISYHSDQSASIINEDYQKFLQIFSARYKFEEKNNLIKNFTGKDRTRWLNFAVKLEQLFGKFIKLRFGAEVNLVDYEKEIYKKFVSLSTERMEYSFKQLTDLIKNTVEYDLDLKASTIILLSYFDNPSQDIY